MSSLKFYHENNFHLINIKGGVPEDIESLESYEMILGSPSLCNSDYAQEVMSCEMQEALAEVFESKKIEAEYGIVYRVVLECEVITTFDSWTREGDWSLSFTIKYFEALNEKDSKEYLDLGTNFSLESESDEQMIQLG